MKKTAVVFLFLLSILACAPGSNSSPASFLQEKPGLLSEFSTHDSRTENVNDTIDSDPVADLHFCPAGHSNQRTCRIAFQQAHKCIDSLEAGDNFIIRAPPHA